MDICRAPAGALQISFGKMMSDVLAPKGGAVEGFLARNVFGAEEKSTEDLRNEMLARIANNTERTADKGGLELAP